MHGNVSHVTAYLSYVSAWGVPGNALIDFEEFLTLIAVRSQHQHSAAEIVEAFQLFDVEGTGYVDIPRFRAAMKELVRSGQMHTICIRVPVGHAVLSSARPIACGMMT